MKLLLLVLLAAFIVAAESQLSSRNHSRPGGWLTRPQVYVGLRTTTPSEGFYLHWGLLWFPVDDYQSWQGLRHQCTVDQSRVRYDWLRHDGQSFGQERILDDEFSSRVDFKWQLVNEEDSDSVAIQVKFHGDNNRKWSVINYWVMERLEEIDEEKAATSKIPDGFSLNSKEFGLDLGLQHFRMDSKSFENGHWHIYDAPESVIWNAEEITKSQLGQILQSWAQQNQAQDSEQQPIPPPPEELLRLVPSTSDVGNLVMHQQTVDMPFEMRLGFGKAKSMQTLMSTEEFQSSFAEKEEAFDNRFNQVFKVSHLSADDQQLAKQSLANLLGGVGFFYGDSIIAEPHDDEDDDEMADETDNFTEDDLELEKLLGETLDVDEPPPTSGPAPAVKSPRETRKAPPASLWTATPSRPFFPRGFLWDEGFHQMLVVAFNPAMSLGMIQSWLQRMDDRGWIGREQILGAEARKKVPAEFQPQVMSYANPPTLIMPVVSLIRHLRAHRQTEEIHDLPQIVLGTDEVFGETVLRSRIETMFPMFMRHFEWFLETQKGKLHPEISKQTKHDGPHVYRWRGRMPNHCLASGLDDFPRPNPPSKWEVHLDLTAWVGFYAKSLLEISKFLDLSEHQSKLRAIIDGVTDSLLKIHWDKKTKLFCDVSYYKKEVNRVCRKGYMTLLPLALGLLPVDSIQLKHTLDLLEDKSLVTEAGIRSMAEDQPEFAMGENYWRGPIWINVNFLVLRSLKVKYSVESGPYQDQSKAIYDQLRRSISRNILDEYARTGFLWEQYDATEGFGQRSRPFSGWTSLVLNILTEIY